MMAQQVTWFTGQPMRAQAWKREQNQKWKYLPQSVPVSPARKERETRRLDGCYAQQPHTWPGLRPLGHGPTEREREMVAVTRRWRYCRCTKQKPFPPWGGFSMWDNDSVRRAALADAAVSCSVTRWHQRRNKAGDAGSNAFHCVTKGAQNGLRTKTRVSSAPPPLGITPPEC